MANAGTLKVWIINIFTINNRGNYDNEKLR